MSVSGLELSLEAANFSSALAVPSFSPAKPSDFILLRVIGRGAFGKVLQVAHATSGRVYAMKVYSKRFLQEQSQVSYTLSEAAISARLRHPFIVPLRFAFQSRSRMFLISDYCAGGELFNALRKHGLLLEDAARVYLAELVLALEHLHAHGVVHRDIKPENVLLDAEGHVAVTDFGLAKDFLGERARRDGFTDWEEGWRTRSLVGTDEYLAPEMILGSKWWAAQQASAAAEQAEKAAAAAAAVTTAAAAAAAVAMVVTAEAVAPSTEALRVVEAAAGGGAPPEDGGTLKGAPRSEAGAVSGVAAVGAAPSDREGGGGALSVDVGAAPSDREGGGVALSVPAASSDAPPAAQAPPSAPASEAPPSEASPAAPAPPLGTAPLTVFEAPPAAPTPPLGAPPAVPAPPSEATATPPAPAPVQPIGAPYGHSVDFWGLGTLAFEMMTGAPFPSFAAFRSGAPIFSRILPAPPPPPPFLRRAALSGQEQKGAVPEDPIRAAHVSGPPHARLRVLY
jgi:serine/threonine protein kinase